MRWVATRASKMPLPALAVLCLVLSSSLVNVEALPIENLAKRSGPENKLVRGTLSRSIEAQIAYGGPVFPDHDGSKSLKKPNDDEKKLKSLSTKLTGLSKTLISRRLREIRLAEMVSQLGYNSTSLELVDHANATSTLYSIRVNNPSLKSDGRPGLRIINGELVPDNEMFPQVSALIAAFSDGSGFSFCTGSLLDGGIVLSAAHCLSEFPTDDASLVVCTGSKDLNEDLGSCGVATVAVIPPEYDENEIFNGNDLAVLKLDRDVLVDGVERMKVSFSNLEEVTDTVAVGFGRFDLDQERGDNKMRYLDTKLVPNDQCKLLRANDSVDNPDLICSDGNHDGSLGTPCHGDSGGPLVIFGDEPQDHIQIGVLSFGSTRSGDCDTDLETVYMSLHSEAHRSFIETKVAEFGGSLLVAEAEDGAPMGTCQEQADACTEGVNLSCVNEDPIDLECVSDVIPALKCLIEVARRCAQEQMRTKLHYALKDLEKTVGW